MSIITVQDLRKEFGELVAVEGANFGVEEGEFVSILGPSGSGKSTILRMIAGFETPTSGSVEILGDDVTHTAPFDRDVNMVFQDLALFPHLSVAENIGYGLKQKGVPKGERRERTSDMLEMVDLSGYGEREIDQLSGGEQQRVALARALVNEPSVVLFDEPLASLDRKLRQHMQFELQRIQEETGITFLYVTHDQEVAMSVSDRMIVLNEGTVEQIATAEEIYRRPASKFVAQFIGDLNSVSSETSSSDDGRLKARIEGEWVDIGNAVGTVDGSGRADVGVRPQDVSLSGSPLNGDGGDGRFQLHGTVQNRMYRGDDLAYIVDTDYEEFLIIDDADSRERFDIGEDVFVSWQGDNCLVFQGDGVA